MRRRDFIAAIGSAAIAGPSAALAQRSGLPLVGFMGLLTEADTADLLAAFNQGLNGMGFVDGRNVVVEARWAEGQTDRLPAMANDLVRRRSAAALIATGSGAAVLAAKSAAAGIISVFFLEGDLDPVKSGLVSSLAKPGGNITGIYLSNPDLPSKRLEALQQAVPSAAVIGMLVNPTWADTDSQSSQALGAANALGVTIKFVHATNPDEIDDAFSTTLVKPQIGALLVADDPFLLSQRDRIIAAAATNALPAMYPQRAYVMSGGLMSYGPKLTDAYQQAGADTAKILVGQKPTDLPVAAPDKFELLVNRKAATALQMPASVISGADRVI